MAGGQIGIVARQFSRLFGGGTVSGMDEGELLRRFATRRDPAALEALVSRHGPMVLGVCRRVLGHSHDADDAFQATFLILAKKAGTIRDPDRLGPWLHGVAHRVAVRSRANSAKRRSREQLGAQEAAMATSSNAWEFDRAELRATLDDEVRRLPEKFRTPVILCYLDGLTHDEAAARLRCPVGTIRSRLATGRDKLRDRLTRRGVVVPSTVFAAALSAEAASAAVPSVLLDSTIRAAISFAATGAGATAAGMVSASVASLAEGVTTTMMLAKIKVLGGVLLASVLTVGVGGAAAVQFGSGGRAPQANKTDDTLDALIGKMRDQVRASEDRTKQLEDEIAKLRKELEDARAQIRRHTRAETQNRANLDAARIAAGVASALPLMGQSLSSSKAAADEYQKMKAAGKGAGGRLGMGMAMPGQGGTMGSGGGAALEMMGAMGGSSYNNAMRGTVGKFQSQIGDYIVIQRPDSDKIFAYNPETASTTSYTIPPGTTVQPIMSGNLLALYPQGKEIKELAVFVPKAGKWFTIDLKSPAKDRVVPIPSNDLVAFSAGRHVYAFSGPGQSWDVLELEDGAKPVPIVSHNRITVEHDDRLYIFSLKTGKWTYFDAKTGKVVTPEEK